MLKIPLGASVPAAPFEVIKMNDYISRQTAIDALMNDIEPFVIVEPGTTCVIGAGIKDSDVIKMLEAMPSADVQPVRHGHWIIKDNPGTGWYRVTCSECGEDVTSVAPVIGFFPNARVTWDFCPECGARMDGEQNETD